MGGYRCQYRRCCTTGASHCRTSYMQHSLLVKGSLDEKLPIYERHPNRQVIEWSSNRIVK